MKSLYLPLLCLLLVIKFLLLVFVFPFTEIHLAPDEAQYWTWSQHLDWGYYSKPPAIAWQIWLGTQLFGNTELGVRFGSFLLGGIFLPLAVHALAKNSRLKDSTAFWSAVVLAFSPLGISYSFLATTDPGYLLFWTLSCAVLAQAIAANQTPNYLLIGLCVLFGALFKWPVYLFWLVVLAFGRFIHYPKLLLGIALSLVGLMPSVIWNAAHDWATFRHVSATLSGGPKVETMAKPFFQGNFGDFIGGQALLISPIFFLLLIVAYAMLFVRWKTLSPSLRFVGLCSFLLFALFSLLALIQKMQGNWCLFAFPPAIVFFCWWLNERVRLGQLWLGVGLAFSLIFSVTSLSVTSIQSHALFAEYPISYKLNAFRHCTGWDRVGEVLTHAGFDSQRHFLFADRYQTTSILSFYGPEQKQAYFFNLGLGRKNQFFYWPAMAQEQIGRTGYFVYVENSPYLERDAEKFLKDYQEHLEKYFSTVKFVEIAPLFYSYSKMVKGAIIFRCENYNGQEPGATELY